MDMFISRRLLLAAAIAGTAFGMAASASAQDWRSEYKELRFGISSSENEKDAVARYEPFAAYLTKKLGVPVTISRGTDYAAVVESLRSENSEFASMGPANYALARKVMGEGIRPVAVQLDADGVNGYHSVIAVRADSPYQTLEDLKGKSLAFADPNSTSGYAVPTYFMKKAGIEPDTYFSNTAFSGSHELGIIALLNGTFDAAATHWTNEKRGNIQRMEEKGMIPANSTRIVWTSERIPGSPIVVRTDLPEELQTMFEEAVFAFQSEDPEAFKLLTDGLSSGFGPAKHEDYLDIIAITEENSAERRRKGS